jgi:NTE family protein
VSVPGDVPALAEAAHIRTGLRPIKIGVALGSGSARGWAHIGVLRALAERGIRPDVVVGASIGSLVGAAYASGQLDTLEAWAGDLSRMDVWRLLDTTIRRGGVMSGNRLMRAVRERLTDHEIQDLPIPFAAVATELDTGVEVWLRQGSMLDAVRASSGIPGMFTPTWYQDRWLIDGGVVNPVPVSTCRALGADYVIAVNLNAHLSGFTGRRRFPPPREEVEELPEDVAEEDSPAGLERLTGLVHGLVDSLRAARGSESEPGLFDVVGASIAIMEDRITRSRMVGDPPDIVIEPDLPDFELMDFHRAAEAIPVGQEAVARVDEDLDALKAVLP